MKKQDFSPIKRKWLNISEAAGFLGVSQDTLRRWEKKGKLIPRRTVGSHRRYSRKQLERILQQPLQQTVSNVNISKTLEIRPESQISATMPATHLTTINQQQTIKKDIETKQNISEDTTSASQPTQQPTPSIITTAAPKTKRSFWLTMISPKWLTQNLISNTSFIRNNLLTLGITFLILVLLIASYLLLKQIQSEKQSPFLTPIPSYKEII